MPHFAPDALDADPEGLERLRQALHGTGASARAAADRPGRAMPDRARPSDSRAMTSPAALGRRHATSC